MVEALCEAIKRNMYAYDEDTKIISSLVSNTSKNYSPIVYYKYHGHMFLMDDASVTRSVAESNKRLGLTIHASTIEDKSEVVHEEVVHHINTFDLDIVKDMTKGIYLVKDQSNFDADIIEFVRKYHRTPRTRTKCSNIIQIAFQEGLVEVKDKKSQKWVIVCIDATRCEPYSYDQIKHVADVNNIQYTNEGIGSLVISVLENSRQPIDRVFLSESERATFLSNCCYNCAGCSMKCEYLEIDHIRPLASGGTNDIGNLQPLCKDCHLKKTAEEKKRGDYSVKDTEGSIFNRVVHDNVFRSNEFRSWQFVEKVPVRLDQIKKIYKSDMRKCRRNITYYSKYEFPVYSVMDIPHPFSGKVQCGMYYVETSNVYPFRGNGWYSQPLVEYGMVKNLIVADNIIAELLPSSKLKNDYFKEPIDTLLKAFECEPALQKLSVNTLVGLFGKIKHTSALTKFTTCPYEASTWWSDKDHKGKDRKDTKKEVFIRTIPLDGDEKLYEGIFSENVDVESTKYPLYKQILEMEAVELHRLEQLIVKRGGIVLDRNTDAIRYTVRSEVNLPQCWDEAGLVPKYQQEEPKPLEKEVLPRMHRDTPYDASVFDLKWDVQDDYDGTAEEVAKVIVSSGKSFHIDGRAGTGKSYLVNRIIDELKSQKKHYLGFSPTNKGARIINGNTIHSIYFKYKSCKRKLIETMQNIDYLFIDEVSMMIKDFYSLFSLIKKTFPHMKFIIAGDFGQLPPVCDNWDGDYENSPAMNLLCGGNRIKLTTCRRADNELYNLCMDVGAVDRLKFKPTEKTYLNIAYCHTTRIRVNRECMERYILERGCKTVDVKCNKFNPKTQDVKLGEGMRVVAHTTNNEIGIVNSQLFTILRANASKLDLRCGDDIVTVPTKDFHKYFYMGFCLTVHASQGETFDGKYTIYNWNHERMCPKAQYVALSRGTNIKNIQIA